jgi:RNA polymerase sigma-70 factor (ECF subfamily)
VQETIEASFTEFVVVAEPKLRRALCAAFGRELGLDAAAEALAYGWEHWDRVEVMANPAGYLWGVGRNWARRRGRRRLAYPIMPVDREPWVEPELPAALSRLSEKQRVVVILIHCFEWTQAEVAELLGVSKSTVQNHLERGLAKLRHKLGVQA